MYAFSNRENYHPFSTSPDGIKRLSELNQPDFNSKLYHITEKIANVCLNIDIEMVFIVGVVFNHDIAGVVFNHDIVGVVFNHDIVGVVFNQYIVGVVFNQYIVGVVFNHDSLQGR